MNALHNQRCLVTGAAGFIGSHLVQALVEQGARVRALVHYHAGASLGNLDLLPPDIASSIEVVRGDITDPTSIDRAVEGCDVVFHLAALISIPYSLEATQRYFEVNTSGTLKVIEACRRHAVARLVHTSTSEVYGTAQTEKMTEAHPLCAQSPYAATKIAADALIESMYRNVGLPVTTVRPFNTYGPRQSTRAVIPAIVSQLLRNADKLTLGDLRPTRDFLHVSDTVAGFIAAACCDNAIGKVFNLATGRDVSIASVAQTAMTLLNCEVPIVQDDNRTRPPLGEVTRLCGDATSARETLGWTPKVSLEQGLQSVIDFIRSHPMRFNPTEQWR